MNTKNQTNSTYNPSNKELLITREFNAKPDVVWKAWTDPELMKKWWGPKDFTSPTVKLDFRQGGKYLNCMRGPDGKEYWSTGVYKEIVPKKKIVVTDSFADEKGNVVPSSYYGMKNLPMELQIQVILEELKDGKTKMELHHIGIPDGEMRNLTDQGWNQSFDKLDGTISKM